jgi:predicted O-methyltransferase YrrM
LSNRYYDAGPPREPDRSKVLLATTAYDSPDASYTFSIARSREALSAAGIQSAYYLLQGNCHVDDARNAVVRDFLDSDCTELVFLDADVSWEPPTLVTLCGLDRDIVGGVYPYRRESDEETMPVRHLPQISVDDDGLIEVEGLPTGFMRIKRHVLETMAATAKHYIKDAGKPHPVIFERDYFGGGRRGGDIRFCMVWREMGGKVFAAPELRLGHCGHILLKDSLGASLRRQGKSTLRWLVEQIKGRTDTLDTYVEAFKAFGNKWAASSDVLQVVAGLAKSADGPILEIGTGLSSIILAAATDQRVFSVEHNATFAETLETMVADAGVKNVSLVTAPIVDGWYDLAPSELPDSFALAFVDGPPREGNDRMRFFDLFGDRCKIIVCDDADDGVYVKKLMAWAKSRNRTIQIDGRCAVILPTSTKDDPK